MDFLWNDLDDHQKFHLIDWKLVCHSHMEGGFIFERLGSLIRLFLENGFGHLVRKEIVFGGKVLLLSMAVV